MVPSVSVFTYVYYFMIEKDISDCQNVSFNLLLSEELFVFWQEFSLFIPILVLILIYTHIIYKMYNPIYFSQEYT